MGSKVSKGGITIDLSAQLVNFDNVLKEAEEKVKKVNLGSELGKEIRKNLLVATNELKSLQKTPMVKVTNDSQLNNLANKINTVAYALQNVFDKGTQLDIDDLNLDLISDQVNKAQQKVAEVKEKLMQESAKAIRELIKNDNTLSSFLEGKGVNIEKDDPSKFIELLSQRATEAKKNVENLTASLKKLQAQQQEKQEQQKKIAPGVEVLPEKFETLRASFQEDQKIDERGSEALLGRWDTIKSRFSTKKFPITKEGYKSLIKKYLANLRKEAETRELGNEDVTALFDQLQAANVYSDAQGRALFYQDVFGIDVNSFRKNKNGAQAKDQALQMLRGYVSNPRDQRERIQQFLNEDAVTSTVSEQTLAKWQEDLKQGKNPNEIFRQIRASITAKINQLTDLNKNISDELNQLNEEINDVTNKRTQNDNDFQASDTMVKKLQAKQTETNYETNADYQQAQQEEAKILANYLKEVRESFNGSPLGNGGNPPGMPPEESEKYAKELDRIREKEQALGHFENVIKQWFSVYAVLRIVSNAARKIISDIQELDKTITEIAIVTNMTQKELWGQMQTYSEMARSYASSISGVYKVSQLYYQQGLQTADVIALTAETLKMARISGLDYTDATNFMTNAVRSFKMEMTDAQRVVDVYSALAAASATNVTELATAMSKTASSAEAVGSSFENTAAMMAVMIEATRESAENIGSAMKSIISRYGEMTADPTAIIDSEGEEMSLNRVDKALQTIGISIHDAAGQFRDFDDVIMDLAAAWDTIDKNTQRYIATIMAGNRQQSRFLALVSSYDRLKGLSETALTSEDAAQLQFLKTLDSVEAKTQQLQTSIQMLYVDSGLEEIYKWILDTGNNIIKTFTEMPKIFNLPIVALADFGLQFANIANVALTLFSLLRARFNQQMALISSNGQKTAEEIANNAANSGQRIVEEGQKVANKLVEQSAEAKEQINANMEGVHGPNYGNGQQPNAGSQSSGSTGGIKGFFSNKRNVAMIGMGASLAGTALSGWASTMSEDTQSQRTKKAWATVGGSVLQGAGLGSMFGPWGMVIGGLAGGLVGAFKGASIATEDVTEKVARLGKAIEDTSNKKIQSKADLLTLVEFKKRYDELQKTYQKDEESRKEWVDLNNQIAASYPELISSMDVEGNYIVSLAEGYERLRDAKIGVYKKDFLSNLSAELEGYGDLDYMLDRIYGLEVKNKGWLETIGDGFDREREIYEKLLNSEPILGELSEATIKSIFGMDISTWQPTADFTRIGTDTVPVYKQTFPVPIEEIDDNIWGYLRKLAEEGYSAVEATVKLKDAFGLTADQFANFSLNENFYNALKAGIQLNDENGFLNTLLNNKLKAASTEWLTVVMQQGYGLEINEAQRAVILAEMRDAWDQYYQEHSGEQVQVDSFGAYREKTVGELYSDFLQRQYDAGWASDFQGEGSDYKPYADESLNELYQNAQKYSREAYKRALESADYGDEIRAKLLDVYDEEVKQLTKNYTSALEQISADKSSDITLPDEFAKFAEELAPSLLQGVIDQIYAIQALELDKGPKESILESIAGLYSASNNIKDNDQRIAAQAAINAADFTSLNGIFELITALENIEGFEIPEGIITALDSIKDNIKINLNTEFSTFSKSIVKKLEDFEKALANASKGMNLEDALAMAEKLDISISDFRFSDGKYFLDNAQKIRESYIKYNTKLIDAIEEEYKKQLSEWTTILDDTDASEDKRDEARTKIAELQKAHANFQATSKEYVDYQVNAILIQNGLILDFLKGILQDPNKVFEVYNSIRKKQFGDLSEEVKPYIAELWKYIDGLTKGIFDQAINSFKDGSSQLVQATTPEQQALLRTLGAVEVAENQFLLAITKDNLETLKTSIEEAAQMGEISVKQAQSLLTDISATEYEDNLYNALTNVIDNYNSFGLDVAFSLANALDTSVEALIQKEYLLLDEKTGQYFINGFDKLKELITYYKGDSSNKRIVEQYNKLIANARKAEAEASLTYIATDFITNRDKLTEENIQALATALNKSYEEVEQYLIANADGTFRIDLTTIKDLLNDNDNFNAITSQLISSQINGILGNLKTALQNQSSGFGFEEIQTYTQQIKDLIGRDNVIFTEPLFEFNNELNAYVMTTQGIIAQIAYARAQLQLLDDDAPEKEQLQTILESYGRDLAEQIDIFAYVEASSYRDRVKSRQELETAIKNYNAYLIGIGKEAIYDVQQITRYLQLGGIDAVKVGEEIAKLQGKRLTSDEAESLYRGQVAPLVDAIDEIEYSVGSIVSAHTAKILKESGYAVTQLGTSGQYVIESAGNLASAYLNLYNQLKRTGEATLSDLNAMMARHLEENTGAKVVSYLGSAAEMTYTEFGEMLTANGLSLTQQLLDSLKQNKILSEIGGGKIRIDNFSALANMMGWSTDSEEYLSALKTYNQAMIALNRHYEQNIIEELQALSSAKPGDLIDITTLFSKITDSADREELQQTLQSYGAFIQDGILHLEDAANIPYIIQALTETAEKAGGLLESEVAELADTLVKVLKDFADLISKGIEGTLSNAESIQLKETASNMLGINLDFTETVNGLKLSNDQAIALYTKLQAIDAASASIVFTSLEKSLTKTGETCENISKTMATIKRLQEEIATFTDGTNQALIEQLSIYTKIAQRQMQDPKQYDFMSRDLPDIYKGPENYWNSLNTAFDAMREAARTGNIGIADFYNIVNEMNTLAELGGQFEFMGVQLDGSMEAASQLIQQGFHAIEMIPGEGAKIKLSKIGTDFSLGADMMSSGVEDGIHAMAQSQIDMLDAMINLLEAVVAMENIDELTGDDKVLDMTDLFPKFNIDAETKDFEESTELIEWATKILNKANEEGSELGQALKDLYFGDESLYDLLEAAANKTINSEEQANNLFLAIQALNNMAKNGDYSLENLIGSITEIASLSGYTGVIKNKDIELAVGFGMTLQRSDATKPWSYNGQDYDSAQEALAAAKLDALHIGSEDFRISTNDDGSQTISGTEVIEDVTCQYEVHSDGTIEYTVDGTTYSSRAEALEAIWKETHDEGDTSSIETFLAEHGETYEWKPKVTVNETTLKNAEAGLIQDFINLLKDSNGKITKEIQEAAKAIGITIDVEPETTLSYGDLSTIYQALGMEEIQQKIKIIDVETSPNSKWLVDLFSGVAQTIKVFVEGSVEGADFGSSKDTSGRLPSFDARDRAATKALRERIGQLELSLGRATGDAERWSALYTKAVEDAKDQEDQIADLEEQRRRAIEQAIDAKAETAQAQQQLASVQKQLDDAQAKITMYENGSIATSNAGMGSEGETSDLGAGTTPESPAEQIADTEKSIEQITIDILSGIKGLNLDDDFSTLQEVVERFQLQGALAQYSLPWEKYINDSTFFDQIKAMMSSSTHVEDALVDEEDETPEIEFTLEEISKIVSQIWQENKNKIDWEKYGQDSKFGQPISLSELFSTYLLQSSDSFSVGQQMQFNQLDKILNQLNGTLIISIGRNGQLIASLQEFDKVAGKTGDSVKQGHKKIQESANGIRSSLSSAASSLANGLNTIVRDVSNVADSLNNIKINLPQITGSNNTSDAGLGKNNATGSFGNALAAGTLMGELGPELWVSHGHYYVAGQNGAEFVNLPDDAIVFNHLQTERLLGKGKAGGHGKPVTNERKATSLATGNVHGGLAMASASDTLAQLKQLRAMWEAIAKMSVSDLGKKAGSGGGGGGGGDGQKVFIADLERWFSIEQEILKLEKDITKEQKIRAKLVGDQVAHGKQLYESYRREFDALTAEIDATQTLADLQQKWYEKRRKDLEDSAISQIFTFDENGVMKYEQYWDESKGSYSGLDILASLYETDANGVSVFKDAGAQMDYLRSALGDSVNDIFAQLSDGSGNAIKANAKPEEFLQAWDDLVNSYKDELTDLYDQYNENQMKVYDLQNNQNEIIQEVIDNQLSLEQRVLTALIDKAQKAIDDLQDSRDALADANQKYIDGLNDSLQKQKDMYDRNEAANDLNKLQRQLAILQRSGGSASQIRSLQQQINDQMQDAYFTAQQDQISAIQEAADKQIERLDYQIDLMTQTLEYQKENGLLWDEVYRIMTTWDDADILAFIQENTASLQGISSLDLKQQLKDASNEIGIFKADWAEQVGQAVATSISQSRYHEPEKMEQPKDDGKNGSSSGTTTASASTSKGGGSGSGSGSRSGGKNNNTNTNVQNKTEYVQVTVRHIVDGKTKQTSNISVAVGTKITPSNYKLDPTKYIYLRSSPLSEFTVKKATIIALYYKEVPTTTTEGKKIRRQHSFDLGGFANGGLVDYTGPAQVHGSKSKPESFFDAQSTAILRDDVLGSINVLDSLLADVSTAGTNSLNLGTSESLSIANPVININVDKIANDYDAKRAGQLAFEEMVKIARQSGNRSLSRR